MSPLNPLAMVPSLVLDRSRILTRWIAHVIAPRTDWDTYPARITYVLYTREEDEAA